MQRASVSHRKPHSADTPRAQWPVYHGVEHAHESVERLAPDSTEWNRAQASGSWWHGMLSPLKCPRVTKKSFCARETTELVKEHVLAYMSVSHPHHVDVSRLSVTSPCAPRLFGRSLASGVKANDALSTAAKNRPRTPAAPIFSVQHDRFLAFRRPRLRCCFRRSSSVRMRCCDECRRHMYGLRPCASCPERVLFSPAYGVGRAAPIL